jgi:hypothetical protein
VIEQAGPHGPGLLGQEGRRREPAEGCVWPDGVVVGLPVLQQVLGVAHAREAVLVQELIADAAVEALRLWRSRPACPVGWSDA